MTESGTPIEHQRSQPGNPGITGAGDVLIGVENAAGMMTLNRPAKLNALNMAMRAQIAEALPRFARDPEIYGVVIQATGGRAFCAGGDVREILTLRETDTAAALKTFADEYRMNWQLECFTKPIISLMDGMVMGSGAGLTLYGTHRVASEAYSFAMPEVAIGLFPDVGVSHVLAHMPHSIGMYLGLSGARVGPADAFALDLVTHNIPAEEFGDIARAIADADPVDPVLDSRHRAPGAGPIIRNSALIEKIFSGITVEEIMEKLAKVDGPHRDWAAETLSAMTAASPLSLKITHRLIRAARLMDLRETLIYDNRLAARCLDDHDFAEGVRAALIDKTKDPQWRYKTLADVSDETLDQYFAPMAEGELDLPSRKIMQAS